MLDEKSCRVVDAPNRFRTKLVVGGSGIVIDVTTQLSRMSNECSHDGVFAPSAGVHVNVKSCVTKSPGFVGLFTLIDVLSSEITIHDANVYKFATVWLNVPESSQVPKVTQAFAVGIESFAVVSKVGTSNE